MKFKNKFIIVLLLVINILSAFIGNISSAATLDKADLYSKGSCGDLLKYNGVTVYTTLVVYNNNGVEYPAYCVQRELGGVGEYGNYQVTTDGMLTNVAVWRAVTNGYPYKTVSALGCETIQEAYTATKQAVYCMLYGNNPDNYTAIGDAGERTLNALKNIVAKAKASNATKVSATLNVSTGENEWIVADNYVEKTFEVTGNATIGNYNVSLSGSIPEDTVITDDKNNVKNSFSGSEKFKIRIPIVSLNKDGEIAINVKSKLNTKPVLYGKSPNSNQQDYAITVGTYEDASGISKIKYYKNDTKIEILKQDAENKEPLKGVKFELLDENKKIIYSELTSDLEGKIVINNMKPGKYYLKEIETNLGYVQYDKLIEINLELNETVKVTVNNSKKDETNISNKEEEIVVNKNESNINVSNKEESTNINENKENINIDNKVEVNNSNTNEVTQKTENNIKVENTNQTVIKLPKTGM